MSALPVEIFNNEVDPSPQVHILTLTTVLGSIALICLAMVVITFIVVRRRRAKNPRFVLFLVFHRSI